ncbi:Leucine aminopeptidase [Magnetospirillum sp. LM-5]|uniref:leucyl aminopeptidase family protein n=1 Tax=Magnetospirillum sp. LM-5 TaxID=2681466 RepID=UPI001385B4CA|nr:leucyl aminopeptidase family protein [Magnetospirillum sp. LM-5]CAA7621114.1 Leucine aminopeptidase [Magnetospirillum sp. LM-5]
MPLTDHLTDDDAGSVPIRLIRKSELAVWLGLQPQFVRSWVETTAFQAEPGAISLVPGADGKLSMVLAALGEDEDPWAGAALAARLPVGLYRLAEPAEPKAARWLALSWVLATYVFGRYKTKPDRTWPRLVWPEGCDRALVDSMADAIALVRDLINVPAADMGPADLAAAAESLASRFGAGVRVIVGDGLLVENYPAIHAVGKAAAHPRQPRLIDLVWGDDKAPRLTLVGKGVCFDTGGLDLKAAGNMKLMKKDMGGAAHVLGLASMVMAARLPVRLRVLIPAVENAIGGDAMRPLDVLATRKGLTVEVGNTDAEGRLILADALAEASREKPELLIDIATLTGAARTALGTDIATMFSNNDLLAADLMRAGEDEHDPIWRLPLHKPYRRMLDSKVADLSNVSDGPHAGAITAALFLQEFVGSGIPWAHFDIMAWNGSGRPGRPDGGEAMAIRAIFAVILARFGTIV